MSETPRTDALIGRNRKLDKMTDVALYLAEIAESHADLERELTERTRERDEFQRMAGANGLAGLEMGREIEALRAEIERLREAAQEFIRDYIEGDMGDIKSYVRGFSAAITPAGVTHDD